MGYLFENPAKPMLYMQDVGDYLWGVCKPQLSYFYSVDLHKRKRIEFSAYTVNYRQLLFCREYHILLELLRRIGRRSGLAAPKTLLIISSLGKLFRGFKFWCCSRVTTAFQATVRDTSANTLTCSTNKTKGKLSFALPVIFDFFKKIFK